MSKPPLPEWVKPGAIALYQSTGAPVLFAIAKAQKERGTDATLLSDALAGGNKYPLAECRAARVGDLETAQGFVFEGHFLSLFRTERPNIFRLADGNSSALIRVPLEDIDFEQSVRSFASFFNGVILPEEVQS